MVRTPFLKKSELSLADASAANSCLHLKGVLGAHHLTTTHYLDVAHKIREEMGDEPDIDSDHDTRIAVGRFDTLLIRRAADFTLANAGLVVGYWTRVHVQQLNLLPTFGEGFIADFRERVIQPGVENLMQATVELQEHL